MGPPQRGRGGALRPAQVPRPLAAKPLLIDRAMMPGGLQTTFNLLANTPNEASAELLLPALDSFETVIQEGALTALLNRRSVAGQHELLKRLHRVNDRWRKILHDNRGRMSRGVRDALLSGDEQLFRNGCQAAVWFAEFDLMPALITVVEDSSSPHGRLAAETLLTLARDLFGELAAPRHYADRRDPQLARTHCLNVLESSVQRSPKHRSHEVVEAFLILANRENPTLRRILADPRDPMYVVLVQALRTSEHPGVMSLLLNFLEDAHAPMAPLGVIGRRPDAPFIRRLLERIGATPSTTITGNLRRIDAIDWVRGRPALLGEFDGPLQQAAVNLVVASGMKRWDYFILLEYLVRNGQKAGRIAATVALAELHGAQANAAVQRALGDSEPEVRAAALSQIRHRGITGALAKLIAALDSPHECEREAARGSLSEFTLQRLIAAFDHLDDAVRFSTGQLVRKVDPNCENLVRVELDSLSRTRRLRGIGATVALGLVTEMEERLIDLLGHDEDHLVRQNAARALSQANSLAAVEALEAAHKDRNVPVQAAARESLDELRRRQDLTDLRESGVHLPDDLDSHLLDMPEEEADVEAIHG